MLFDYAQDTIENDPTLNADPAEGEKSRSGVQGFVIASSFGQTREGGHIVYDQLPTPSSPDESESEERVRIQGILFVDTCVTVGIPEP